MNRFIAAGVLLVLVSASAAYAQTYNVVDSDLGGPMLLQYTAYPSYNATRGGWDFFMRATNTGGVDLTNVGLTLQFLYPLSGWDDHVPLDGQEYSYLGGAQWQVAADGMSIPATTSLQYIGTNIGGFTPTSFVPTSDVSDYSLISSVTSHSIVDNWNASNELPFEAIGNIPAGQHIDFMLYSDTPQVYLDNFGYFLSQTPVTLITPEPSSVVLVAMGVAAGLAVVARRRRAKCGLE